MPLPNSNSMVINADHRGMVRYPDREDKNYQKVKECLRSMVDSIAEDHHTDQGKHHGPRPFCPGKLDFGLTLFSRLAGLVSQVRQTEVANGAMLCWSKKRA